MIVELSLSFYKLRYNEGMLYLEYSTIHLEKLHSCALKSINLDLQNMKVAFFMEVKNITAERQ